MSQPTRALSKDEALAELETLQADDLIRLEAGAGPGRVSLDGWDPVSEQAHDGDVAGVVVRFLSSGSTQAFHPAGGAAPDRLDPRNALALVRLCQWLAETYGVFELYHLGISGDTQGAPGSRVDCHGQGRAVDFVGVQALADDGTTWILTVQDDWGSAVTEATPSGTWPAGTGSAVRYRLDDPNADPFIQEFFRELYNFIASQWQDRSSGPNGDEEPPTEIGEGSLIMHPDHPTSAPGTKHGREAHTNHIHMQIGVTGTE
ncbi:MAG: hypothetical protein M3400_11365 [Actinomycetota bacterium]|nr:hypothetical protein [Actinomycetota bacterium]